MEATGRIGAELELGGSKANRILVLGGGELMEQGTHGACRSGCVVLGVFSVQVVETVRYLPVVPTPVLPQR